MNPSISTIPKPRSQKRQRPATATARLTQSEMEQLRRAAQSRGLSVSDFMRGLVQQAV